MSEELDMLEAEARIEAERLCEGARKSSDGPLFPPSIEKQIDDAHKMFFMCGVMWAMKRSMMNAYMENIDQTTPTKQ